jgi:hypothetical protein
MKTKIFTLIICALTGVGLNSLAQVNTGTGTGWEGLAPGSPLVINENFQGFPFFHSDTESNQGNSDNVIDPISGEIVYGYMNKTVKVPLVGTQDSAVTYIFDQCAFAPQWKTAYAFRDAVENTPNVSDGFVEISRTYASTPPTVHGSFVVDLRKLEFVDIIQWSHSSTGGNKRGVLCEVSVDNGTTWDTLRYQPGTNYNASFTKDVFTHVKTPNTYRCDPSAFGMTWEDGIWAENIMLRFGECGGQTARIHDLKVYGDYTATTSAKGIKSDDLKIYSYLKKIRISEQAKVAVYNITGKLVKTADHSNLISMDDMPSGIYLVKAMAGNRAKTAKVLIK